MIKKLFVTIIFIFSLDASAWWDTGHKLVCDEAYKLLTADTKNHLDPMLKEHGSFGTACLWADWVKTKIEKIPDPGTTLIFLTLNKTHIKLLAQKMVA